MRLITLCVLAVLALPAAADEVETTLKRMTNELLAAVAPGNAEVWKRYTHERLIYVSESNQRLTRAQLLEELKPLPKGLTGKLEVGPEFNVEQHGNVAVATYIADEWLDFHGQIIENDFRMTDTWLETDDGWRLIASQVLAVLEDPPAIALPRETLCDYNGTYRLTSEIVTKIACTDDGLSSERTGRPAAAMKAEVRDVFFTPGAPRTRRIFLRDASGAVTAFVDRREGLDIRWTKEATTAPVAHDGSHDFDFHIGTWKTHVKRRLRPLTGSNDWVEMNGTTVVRKVWNGRANLVELEADGFQGLSLRLYNPAAKQWSLSYAGSSDGALSPPTVGSFRNGRGEFYSQETYNGRSIFVRFVISDITPDSARFEQAFSDDGGKTWEVNWIATDTRVR